ncbi:MAG: alpha/beta fold hydrolase [Chitinivibrionales bacterium]|nr:alpha/beta fold hydrolase [Chitinivibrionales bacterium]
MNNCTALVAVIFLCGCMSLDPFLFSGEKLDGYMFDAYTGEQECSDAVDSLDAYRQSGLVAHFEQSYIHQFTLSSSGETIAAVLLAADTVLAPQDTIIVYFHGKGPHIDYYWPRIRLLFATGYPVLAIDYQGFGMSTGTPDENALYSDGQCAIDYCAENLGNPVVVVYGFSLGSMVACEITARSGNTSIARLVLECPLSSVETILDDAAYLNLPGQYVTTYDGDNRKKIRSVTQPFFWLHGTEDETLARETQGQPVWNNYAGGSGVYIKAVGATHRTVPQTTGYLRYVSAVKHFIRTGSAEEFPVIFADAANVEWGN